MKEEVIAFTDPKSPVSEMFKTLRTNIQFMNTNKPLKTLLVTSTLPGEGKSWTAANLAVTFAQAGKKVLLIDADMRKGRQFNIFEVPPTPGLSNYLSGVIDGENVDYELERFIKGTELDNLSIMPAGNVPPNPTELLVSEKMINLIKKVDEMYDITIFDGTPGLLVADASILSRIVDSTIIVTAHNETKIDNVSEVKKAIENIGGKVAGVVINKIPISAKKYENTYYYGHTSPAIVNDKKKKKHNMGKQFFKQEETMQEHQENIIEKIYNKSEQKEDEYEEPTIKQIEEPAEEIKKKEETKPIEEKPQASEEDKEEYVKPKLSWEEEAESAYEQIKHQINSEISKPEPKSEYTLDQTQNVLDQINKYLDEQKNNLKNGGKND